METIFDQFQGRPQPASARQAQPTTRRAERGRDWTLVEINQPEQILTLESTKSERNSRKYFRGPKPLFFTWSGTDTLSAFCYGILNTPYMLKVGIKTIEANTENQDAK